MNSLKFFTLNFFMFILFCGNYCNVSAQQSQVFADAATIQGITQSQLLGINSIPKMLNTGYILAPSLLSNLCINSEYTINVPNANGVESISFVITSSENNIPNVSSFSGDVLAPNKGHIIISNYQGIIGGLIQLNSTYYLITPISDGEKSVILQMDSDNESFGEVICGESSGDGNYEEGENVFIFDDPPGNCENESECEATINVLAVLDQKFYEWAGGFGYIGFIPIGLFYYFNQLNYLNKAFSNSKINAKFNFNAVRYDLLQNSTDPEDDLWKFRSNPDIHNLRTLYEADIILKLSTINYSPNVAGFTSLIGPNVFNASAALFNVSYFLSTPQLIAHEVGHLFGARHNRSTNYNGDDDTEVCSHALVILGPFVNQLYSTITVSGSSSSHKLIPIMHYSNPEVLYGGFLKTGKEEAYNAAIMNTYACYISKANMYREMRPKFSYNYTSVCKELNTFNQCVELTVPQNGRALQPPYHIYWYWNDVQKCPYLDPTQSKLVDITENLCYDFPISSIPNSISNFFLSVKIEDLNGEYITLVSNSINIDRTVGCSHTSGLKSKAQGKWNNQVDKSINPESFLNTITDRLGTCKVNEVFNIEGRKMNIPSDCQIEELKLILSPGIYFIRSNGFNIDKIVITW